MDIVTPFFSYIPLKPEKLCMHLNITHSCICMFTLINPLKHTLCECQVKVCLPCHHHKWYHQGHRCRQARSVLSVPICTLGPQYKYTGDHILLSAQFLHGSSNKPLSDKIKHWCIRQKICILSLNCLIH